MNADNTIEAVITSFNQKSMICEAVESVCRQTIKPVRILVVDDGSTDEMSVSILNELESDRGISVPLEVIRQPNGGVSAARNWGIRRTRSPFVLVLDGDDSLEPSFLEETSNLLIENPSLIAASSWLHTFGVLKAVVRPSGGDAAAFLSHNACPATHLLRRRAFLECGGYDETMRSGFEDWDFFLNMLEAVPGSSIGIVEKPLINYRTAPASSNIKSMEKRLTLMRYIIEKHIRLYRSHFHGKALRLGNRNDSFQVSRQIKRSVRKISRKPLLRRWRNGGRSPHCIAAFMIRDPCGIRQMPASQPLGSLPAGRSTTIFHLSALHAVSCFGLRPASFLSVAT